MAKEFSIGINSINKINYVQKAQEIYEALEIPELLRLKNRNDAALAGMYLTQRIVKANIYESSFIDRHPLARKASNLSRFTNFFYQANKTRLEQSQEVLEDINSDIEMCLKEYYPSPEQKRRAKTLELAINQLFADATQESSKKFKTNPEFVKNWMSRWQSELNERQPE